MPEGPFKGPRLTNLGPFSRATEEEVRSRWDDCTGSDEVIEICRSIKFHAIQTLEGQGVVPECETLTGINEGNCGELAIAVFKDVDIDDLRILKVGHFDHLWLEFNGMHFDAEAPSGVDDPFKLPFFERVPLDMILENARMLAETRGEKPPERIEDTIKDINYGLDN